MGWYRFGEFELDSEGFVLKRGGDVLPMQPKVFDVLRHLIERHGAVVTKAELLSELWADKDVNDSAVAWSVNHIRRALGQRGGRHPIETVPGRGYRFTAEVVETTAARAEPQLQPAVPLVSAFVGRIQVMAELEQVVRASFHGRGRLCVITGEAGIGKTRCADELASAARALGVQVLSGRWPQEPAVPTLWPIAMALRNLARERQHMAARANTLLASASADNDGQHGTRFGLIEEAADLLREAATKQPSLLVLDDLHWADAGSLHLLSFIAEELRELPLCIVATLRDGEVPAATSRDQPLRRLLRHAHIVPLRALDSEQVAELTSLLAQHRPTDALAEAICRASGGIPLFVHEIVRGLLREHGEQALARLPPDAVRLPELARDLLRRDIESLPPSTIGLLSNAAVIGESFDLSLLLGLVELEPESMLERLEPAVAGGQLQSDAPHTYRFVHSLFQSVLYEDLPAAQRVAIHRKLGNLLLARSPTEQRHEIARHFYLSLPAGDAPLVMELARGAGDAAMRAFAYENAIDHYQWALEAQLFGSEADPTMRAELLLALASAQRAAGRTQDSHETSERVLELAREHNLNDLIVRTTRLRRPSIAMSMVVDDVSRSALEALVEGGTESPTPARVRALAQLAWIPPHSENLARSKQLSERAIELARQLPQAEPMFEAMRARLFSLSGPDDLDELLQVTDKMLSPELGPSDGNKADVITARYHAYILAGRMPEADAVLREASEQMRAKRLPEGVFYWTRLELQRRFLDGHFDEADRRWKELHAQALRAGVSYADLFYGAHRWVSLVEREGVKAAFMKPPFEQTQTFSPTRYSHASFARVTAEAGKHDIARAELAAVGDPESFPRDSYYLYLLANLSACTARLGDRTRAEELFALLAPYADLNTPNQLGYYMGSVAYYLGLLCETLGRSVRASTHFEHALERNQSMGYRPGVVRTLVAQGRLARRAGHAGSGNELLARAHNEARELGMKGALGEIEGLRAG